MEKKSDIMTDNEIVKALNGAGLFLRDRAESKPQPLNEYDIALLYDIEKTCDEAATIINRQKEEIDDLKRALTALHRCSHGHRN